MPDYLVTNHATVGDETLLVERIVRAKNEARAIAHIVQDSVTVKRLSIDDAMRLGAEGVKVEVAQ